MEMFLFIGSQPSASRSGSSLSLSSSSGDPSLLGVSAALLLSGSKLSSEADLLFICPEPKHNAVRYSIFVRLQFGQRLQTLLVSLFSHVQHKLIGDR